MLLFTLSNANVLFAKQVIIWRYYTTAKALSITKQVEIINKKEFTKTKLDENIKAFMVYMISFSLNLMLIYPVQKA